jgi:lysosomal acid lipase/cholesteryl ester hydrolase
LQEFWDWSWDELAAYDLPAMLSFLQNQTQSKITYIGHSQVSITSRLVI